MRIISGIHRGMQINAPAALSVRPTTDYAKTGLFNILNNRFDFSEVRALDLYSGTGSLTYELLSRGTAEVTAVDNDAKAIAFIKSMLVKIKGDKRATAVKADVLSYLKNSSGTFDIIIADPPYAITPATELNELIIQGNRLKPGGMFILEHAGTNKLPELPGFIECRVYGQVAFSFYTTEVRTTE